MKFRAFATAAAAKLRGQYKGCTWLLRQLTSTSTKDLYGGQGILEEAGLQVRNTYGTRDARGLASIESLYDEDGTYECCEKGCFEVVGKPGLEAQDAGAIFIQLFELHF